MKCFGKQYKTLPECEDCFIKGSCEIEFNKRKVQKKEKP